MLADRFGVPLQDARNGPFTLRIRRPRKGQGQGGDSAHDRLVVFAVFVELRARLKPDDDLTDRLDRQLLKLWLSFDDPAKALEHRLR